jgi:hypothetical protein
LALLLTGFGAGFGTTTGAGVSLTGFGAGYTVVSPGAGVPVTVLDVVNDENDPFGAGVSTNFTGW